MTDGQETMKDVDHTHPYDDRSAGALFARGPVVAADGGERSIGSQTPEGERNEASGSERERSERDPRREAERSDGGERNAVSGSSTEPSVDGNREADRAETERMKDIDHTPPNGEKGAKRAFERGEEYEGGVVEE